MKDKEFIGRKLGLADGRKSTKSKATEKKPGSQVWLMKQVVS